MRCTNQAVISDRLSESPCALVANAYGWSANMERVMKAQAYARQDDSSMDHYVKQKKTLEINPRHPLIKKLLAIVSEESDENTQTALDLSKYVPLLERVVKAYVDVFIGC